MSQSSIPLQFSNRTAVTSCLSRARILGFILNQNDSESVGFVNLKQPVNAAEESLPHD